MSYLERIEYHKKRVGREHYKVLAAAIQELVPDPQSVLDIGCSAGVLVGEIKAEYRMGIDASATAKNIFELLFPECKFELYDLDSDDRWLGHFDLILCMEVAEHIKNTANLLRLVKESASPSGCTLFWSAAPPGQRGSGHVNLRPYRWWRRQLTDLGWKADEPATAMFFDAVDGKVPQHYADNTRVYRK